ncbi:glycosyltransferase family 4 protein [Paenibacillus humicus]|uniref:glycosyltransferase family 4 protein n=1 Tax=Paenibacillus humicus TaxID=412861 RepID=UPI003D275BD5
MNICIITSSYPLNETDASAAAGMFVQDFARTLSRQGHQVTVLTQAKPGEAKVDPLVNVVRFDWSGGGKRLSTLQLKKPTDLLNILSVMRNGERALFNLLKEKKMDLIIAMWAVPAGVWAYRAFKKFGVPYVTWTLGSDIWIYGRKKLTSNIVKTVLTHSAKLFSDGEALRLETEKIAGKPCAFLPTTRTLPIENMPNIDFNPNKINFLFVGRFHPHKGIDILIDAVNLLENEIKNQSHFYIYGGGELEEELRQKTSNLQLKNISFGGYADANKVSALMRSAHFLIIPSREESIPVVMSDALQCGLPMIVSKVGDMGDLMDKYKVGYSFESENAAELAEKIKFAFGDSKEKYEENILIMKSIFDIDTIAATLIEKVV